LDFFFTDIPVIVGGLAIDVPDPHRPGHMMGGGPSVLSLSLDVAAVVVAVLLIGRLRARK